MILEVSSHYSLYTVNMLVFLIDTGCVLCQVGPNLHARTCMCKVSYLTRVRVHITYMYV